MLCNERVGSRYRFWRGNDGDRGATGTMVGTNLDAQVARGGGGVRGTPVSDSRNYGTAFVLHSRSAPPIRAHGRRVCLRALILPLFSLYLASLS